MPFPRSTRPLVSFIVASYNYQRFIATTLQSILNQTAQDFEVVVVDDGSHDASCDIVRSFDDARIQLHVNEQNMGLVRTYNKALSLASGEYISYLDSDDWIEPRKLEQQLGYFSQHPDTDILGTYVKFFDEDGLPHPNAGVYETFFNQPHDLNDVESWIGDNRLHACSVLLRRSVFDRIGPRDETMTTASDYELWARAHARACRFGMLDVPLLCYRIHDDNASARDPLAPFLEMAYALQNAVVPAIEARGALHLFAKVLGWIVPRLDLGLLTEDQACRLLGLLASPKGCTDCRVFKETVMSDGNSSLLSVGKRLLALYRFHPAEVLRERDVAWRDHELAGRDRDIAWRDNELAARDRDIAWRDNEIAARDRDIAGRDSELAARDRDIAGHVSELAARDRDIAGHVSELAARDRDIAWRDNELAARDRDIAWRDNEIAARDRDIAGRDSELAARNHEIAWRDAEIAGRDRDVAWRDSELKLLAARNQTLQAERDALQAGNDDMRGTTSWRLTKPLRTISAVLRGLASRRR